MRWFHREREVLRVVEAGLGVALPLVSFAGRRGDTDWFAVLGISGADDGDQVVPAACVDAGAAFVFPDGRGDEGAGAIVEVGTFVDSAAVGPQFVAATAVAVAASRMAQARPRATAASPPGWSRGTWA
ncbi:hypothetical protein [Streptomyces sp. NPDC001450]